MRGEPKICRCCGQTLPQPLPLLGLALRGNQQAILERVHRAGKNGVDRDTLLNYVYGNAVDTPVDEVNTLAVQIVQLNKKLAGLKMKIVNDSFGRRAVAIYSLVRL